MHNGKIKITYHAFQRTAKIEGRPFRLNLDQLRDFLKKHKHIYSLKIKNTNTKWRLSEAFPRNITIEKLTLYSNSHISKKINYFRGKIKALYLYSCICRRYIKKLQNRFPNLVIVAHDSEHPDETCLSLPVKFKQHRLDEACSPIDPKITRIQLFLLPEYTTRNIEIMLSNPFEKICIVNPSKYCYENRCVISYDLVYNYIDKSELIKAIISNPATHICLRNMRLSEDEVIQILDKPGIISLSIKDKEGLYPGDEVFDNNYTIQKVCFKNASGTRTLPGHIYLRNMGGELRFKRMKVAEQTKACFDCYVSGL